MLTFSNQDTNAIITLTNNIRNNTKKLKKIVNKNTRPKEVRSVKCCCCFIRQVDRHIQLTDSFESLDGDDVGLAIVEQPSTTARAAPGSPGSTHNSRYERVIPTNYATYAAGISADTTSATTTTPNEYSTTYPDVPTNYPAYPQTGFQS